VGEHGARKKKKTKSKPEKEKQLQKRRKVEGPYRREEENKGKTERYTLSEILKD